MSVRTRRISRAGLLVLAISLTGCSSLPPGSERNPQDRFERYNRTMYRVNDSLDRAIVRPAAEAYVKAAPDFVRTGVGNFFGNLSYTTTIVNDLAQLKLKAFGTDTLRLLVNSTMGIGGLFDPATSMGLPGGDEDFGQTLGRWGVPAGSYVVLPIFGPSTIRDAAGSVADQFLTNPLQYVDSSTLVLGLTAFGTLHGRAELLPMQTTVDRAFDPYAFVRNAYLQRREFQVKDGVVLEDGE